MCDFFDASQVRTIFQAFGERPDSTLSAALVDGVMNAVVKHDRSIRPFYQRVVTQRSRAKARKQKGSKKASSQSGGGGGGGGGNNNNNGDNGKLSAPVDFTELAGLLGALHSEMHK